MPENKFANALEDIKNLIDQSGHFAKYAPFLTVDGKTIQIAGEIITNGARVLLGSNEGARMAAPTGTYTLEDGTELIISDGVIAKFTPAEETPEEKIVREAKEAAALAAEPAQVAEPATVAEPVMADFAAETLNDGTVVFVEPVGDTWIGGKVYATDEAGEKTDALAADGEYTLQDGRKIIIADGLIAEMIEVSEEEVIPEAIAAELKGFQNAIAEKDDAIKALKSEFEAFKNESQSIITQTFELVSKMAALPAADSPRKANRFSSQESAEAGKKKLFTTLEKLAEKNKMK